MDDEKKKVKQAIALEYDPSDEAPRVVATGKGEAVPDFLQGGL